MGWGRGGNLQSLLDPKSKLHLGVYVGAETCGLLWQTCGPWQTLYSGGLWSHRHTCIRMSPKAISLLGSQGSFRVGGQWEWIGAISLEVSSSLPPKSPFAPFYPLTCRPIQLDDPLWARAALTKQHLENQESQERVTNLGTALLQP